MAITAIVDENDQCLVINIVGRFDFSSHNDFRQAYDELDTEPKKVLVNMNQASFIDSSALGMLLILRDHFGKDQANIEIANCNADVRSILEMANFNDLFLIS